MKVTNKLFDKKGNTLKFKINNEMQKASVSDPIEVVYAHIEEVNENGMLIHEGSIKTTRKRYPLQFQHRDFRIEDIVGYIETDATSNEKGELVGQMYFYETPQGQHAKQLWDDGVLDELSVSYYILDYEIIDNLDETTYMDVKDALLKEVSILSVGADRNTGAVDKDTNEKNPEDDADDKSDDKTTDDNQDDKQDENKDDVEPSNPVGDNSLEDYRNKLLNMLIEL